MCLFKRRTERLPQKAVCPVLLPAAHTAQSASGDAPLGIWGTQPGGLPPTGSLGHQQQAHPCQRPAASRDQHAHPAPGPVSPGGAYPLDQGLQGRWYGGGAAQWTDGSATGRQCTCVSHTHTAHTHPAHALPSATNQHCAPAAGSPGTGDPGIRASAGVSPVLRPPSGSLLAAWDSSEGGLRA